MKNSLIYCLEKLTAYECGGDARVHGDPVHDAMRKGRLAKLGRAVEKKDWAVHQAVDIGLARKCTRELLKEINRFNWNMWRGTGPG